MKYFTTKYLYCVLFLIMTIGNVYAQNVNVEEVININKKKPFKINGNISASGTYFKSNQMTGRQPFTYQLAGSVNLSFYELINIPLSINLNNYGANFTYPSLPNRLSLHPSYKWAKAHIGDVSMSMSPYTMNGHQFTGAGIELTPDKWQIMAFGGRLLRAVDYNPEIPNLMPTYKRMGYGGKLRYDSDKFFVGGTALVARDQVKNQPFVMDSLGITPKQNMAFSVEAGISLIQNLTLSAEYGISIMKNDIRTQATPNIYQAVKAGLNYTFLKNNIGVAYERISPDYQTLGAYYFNNDYENVTMNYARSFFNDKLQLSVAGGLQRDDLNNAKAEKNRRVVGSIDLNYTPTERLNASLSASTFQGHRNLKSTFDYINAQTPYDNLDTLNYTQISNNIDFNLNWITRQTEVRSDQFGFNVSFQEAADKQGQYILPGNLTRFLNISTSYGMSFIPQNVNINWGFNATNNYSSMLNMLTVGPIVSVSWRTLKNTLTTSLSFSGNRTYQEKKALADIYNARFSAGYRFWKRHSLQFSIIYQKRDLNDNSSILDIYSATSVMTYSMNF